MGRYDDIINLKYPLPHTKRLIDKKERAGQFSPFAALEGYCDAVLETARYTEREREFDDDFLENLNRTLSYIRDNISLKPLVNVTYFVKDKKKDGGSYKNLEDCVLKIDETENALVFKNTSVPISDIAFITLIK